MRAIGPRILQTLGSEPCALISLLAVEGSTPREAGTRMLVTPTAICGTIGGGNLEFQAIDQARLCLKHPAGTWRIQDYPLGVLLGQCCGGRVRLLIEHLDEAQRSWIENVQYADQITLRTELFSDHIERTLTEDHTPSITARGPLPQAGDAFGEHVNQSLINVLMFGAGHVGMAVANVLKPLPFRLSWFDNRTDVPDGVTVADARTLCAQAAAARGVTLILTHDHALDYELTQAALASQARFIGLIGSQTKRARFFSRLRKDGFDEAQIARITCPIGIAGITGKAPEVIAIATAAQLLQLNMPPQVPALESTLAATLEAVAVKIPHHRISPPARAVPLPIEDGEI